MIVRAKITSKGQITLPKVLREFLGLKNGDNIIFSIQDDKVEIQSAPITTRLTGIFKGGDYVDFKEARNVAYQIHGEEMLSRNAGY